MNTKIFTLLQKNLQLAFNLPKYAKISLDENTVVEDLPWTPARYSKFKDAVEVELSLPCDYVGTLKEITEDLSERYINRFFGEIWKPRTGDYEHTGWELAEEVNKLNPEKVLDVGCGYHPFKGRIQNIIGIDPYNNQADYEVDILDYKVIGMSLYSCLHCSFLLKLGSSKASLRLRSSASQQLNITCPLFQDCYKSNSKGKY
jgi:hypothetical protein